MQQSFPLAEYRSFADTQALLSRGDYELLVHADADGIIGLIARWKLDDFLFVEHFAISEPRLPCFKFNHAMGFAQAAKLMQQSGYCGAYLTVIEPGTVEAGERAQLLPGPREVNLLELFRTRRTAR